jgi:hypothetical protein
MKRLQFLIAVFTASISMISCNSGSEETTEASTIDSNEVKTTTVAAPRDIILVKHKVASFAKWKAAYDAHDSARVSAGIHSYVVARGTEDTNMVMAAMTIDDTAKAKKFLADPSLKTVMQKAGVTGKPDVNIVDIQWLDTASNSTTTRMIITHKVKDWDTWKKAFDSHKQARIDAGLTDRAVGYGIDDKHMVTIVLAISDVGKAKAFAASKDLKDKMTEAGVEGPPTIFMYNVVQKY